MRGGVLVGGGKFPLETKKVMGMFLENVNKNDKVEYQESNEFEQSNQPTTSVNNNYGSDTINFDNKIFRAIGFQASPWLRLIYWNGSSWVNISNPNVMPSGSVQGCYFYIYKNELYLSLAIYASPFIMLYKWNGTTFNNLPLPSTIPTSNVIQFSTLENNGKLLFGVTNSENPFIRFYEWDDSNWYDLPALPTTLTAVGRGVSIIKHNDKVLMFISSSTNGGNYLYEWDNNWNFITKISTSGSIGQGNLLNFQNELYLIAVSASSAGFSTQFGFWVFENNAFTMIPYAFTSNYGLTANYSGVAHIIDNDKLYIFLGLPISPFLATLIVRSKTENKLGINPLPLPISQFSYPSVVKFQNELWISGINYNSNQPLNYILTAVGKIQKFNEISNQKNLGYTKKSYSQNQIGEVEIIF